VPERALARLAWQFGTRFICGNRQPGWPRALDRGFSAKRAASMVIPPLGCHFPVFPRVAPGLEGGLGFAVAIGRLAGLGGTGVGLWRSASGVADMNPAVHRVTPLLARSRAAAIRSALGKEDQSEHHPQRNADDGGHDEKLRR
jgi:hypothetical protein